MSLRLIPILLVAAGLSACQTTGYTSAGLPYGAATGIGNSPIPVHGAAACAPACNGGIPTDPVGGVGDPLQAAIYVGGGSTPNVVPLASSPSVVPETVYEIRPTVRSTHRVIVATTPKAEAKAADATASGGNAPFVEKQQSNDPNVRAALKPAPVTKTYRAAADVDLSHAPTVPQPKVKAPNYVAKTDTTKLEVPNPAGAQARPKSAECIKQTDGSCQYQVPKPTLSSSTPMLKSADQPSTLVVPKP